MNKRVILDAGAQGLAGALALAGCRLPLAVAGCMLLVVHGYGQNLVPNGSFEEYIECPENMAQVLRAEGWYPTNYSPDFFNACSTLSGPVCVPSNLCGYQQAATGVGMAGLATYWEQGSIPEPNRGKEAIGAFLSMPLLPGAPAYVSFKVSATYG